MGLSKGVGLVITSFANGTNSVLKATIESGSQIIDATLNPIYQTGLIIIICMVIFIVGYLVLFRFNSSKCSCLFPNNYNVGNELENKIFKIIETKYGSEINEFKWD